MTNRSIFDSLTGQLEDFVQNFQGEISATDVEITRYVFEPIVPWIGKPVTQANAIRLLDDCFTKAETKFAEITSRLSLDPWMSLLRRFPRQAGFSDGWGRFVTLALIRYASRDRDTTLGKVKSESQYGVVLPYTEDDILDAFRLAFLARAFDELASLIPSTFLVLLACSITRFSTGIPSDPWRPCRVTRSLVDMLKKYRPADPAFDG